MDTGSGPWRGLRALLSASEWADLVQCGVRHSYVRGDRMLQQGQDGQWVLLLVAGRAKVVYAAPDGTEVLLAVRGPGDVLGEFAMQDAGPRSATVQALEMCTAFLVTARAFREFVRRHARESELNRYVMAKVRESTAHTWRLTARRPEAQLAELLLAVVAAAGPDHPRPCEVLMSQEELARGLGLARSSITPILADWKHRGLIEIGRSRLCVLHPDALADLLTSH